MLKLLPLTAVTDQERKKAILFKMKANAGLFRNLTYLSRKAWQSVVLQRGMLSYVCERNQVIK